MMTHVSVTSNGTENSASLLRRYTKQIRGTGIIQNVKGRRYYSRDNSVYKTRQKALRRIENIKKYEYMAKMGKLPERPVRPSAPSFGNNTNNNEAK